MAIHIGEIIKELVKKSGISVTEFSEKINYSRRNTYQIFDKETIDTGLLVKISKVLKQNLFFNYITGEEIGEYKSKKIKNEEILSALQELKTEVKNISGKKKGTKKKG